MAPSPQTRDAGVRRVTRLTSWAVAAAVALSAAVTFVVARAQTGSAADGSNATSTSDTAAPVVIEPGTGTGGGLHPPISVPQQGGTGGGGGVANSGGS